MATGFTLPPPVALELNNGNVAEKFHFAWGNYALATELNEKAEPVQVATILTIIGEEARHFLHLRLVEPRRQKENRASIATFCQPRKIFCSSNLHSTTDQNGTEKASRRLQISYTITPEETLCDRLVFGIHDVKVRERLLRECQFTLKKTDEICLASESTAAN